MLPYRILVDQYLPPERSSLPANNSGQRLAQWHH